MDSNLHHYIAYSYRELARKAIASNELSNAAEYLEQAVDYLDTDASLFADLGNTYFQLSLYDQANNMYLRAMELEASNPFYLEILGQIGYLTGDSDDAVSYWQKALLLQPENIELQHRLLQLVEQGVVEHNGTTEVNHIFQITFDEGMNKEIYNEVWDILENAWYNIGIELDLWPKRKIPVLLLTKEKFTTLTDTPTWAGGVYEGQIKIPIAKYDREKLQEVITHEYVHALIYDTMASRCPWWLNEGLAQHFSMIKNDQKAILSSAREYLKENSINLTSLPGDIKQPEQARIAYSLALSAADFLIQRFTIVTTRAVLFNMREGMPFAKSLDYNTGITFDEFSRSWIESL